MANAEPTISDQAVSHITSFNNVVIVAATIAATLTAGNGSEWLTGTRLLLFAALWAVFSQGMIAVELGIYRWRESSKPSFRRALRISLLITLVSAMFALLFLLKG